MLLEIVQFTRLQTIALKREFSPFQYGSDSIHKNMYSSDILIILTTLITHHHSLSPRPTTGTSCTRCNHAVRADSDPDTLQAYNTYLLCVTK